ncbi:MAG: hypothetical protein KTR35_15255 [Gammaproteobacteria bacterium]|nr:hypothetical protein [Gammaproteobacteria bacterium]
MLSIMAGPVCDVGDLYSTGHLRMVTGIEALLGLLMIGWTASILFLEMRQFWPTEPSI